MSSGNKLFGKRIKELREANSYTQEQLAEQVGLEYQTISRIETGYYFTSYENLLKLSAGLKVPIHELFNYEHFTNDIRQESIDIIKTMDNTSLEFVYKFLRNFNEFKR